MAASGLFKALLLAVWHDLSDVKLAEALDDRASFRRFCGFSGAEPTPERTAFVRFRMALTTRGLDDVLFDDVTTQLKAKAIRVKTGTLVDATIIASASTGVGRRRSWSPEEKAAIVAESLADDETVCGVARRHGLTPQQLFTWRRQARVTTDENGATSGAAFLPAVVVTTEAPDAAPVRRRGRPRRGGVPGMIEVEIGGATVRVGRGAEAKAVTAILLALKVRP